MKHISLYSIRCVFNDAIILLLFLTACNPTTENVTRVVESPTVPPTAVQLTILPTPTMLVEEPVATTLSAAAPVAETTPEPTQPSEPGPSESDTKSLVVCMTEPPVPLNPYVDVATAQTVLAALNDGPLDWVGFVFQPVLLTDVPTVDSGSVTVRDAAVQAGNAVFNPATGEVEPYTGADTTLPQMVIRFVIRSGVQWSDGASLTAHDSIYAFEQLRDSSPEVRAMLDADAERLISQTSSYVALDDLTVEWIGVPGFVTADLARFFFPPLPQHATDTLETTIPTFGWGAFHLVEWVPGDHLLVERNPTYFRADEGLPRLDSVTIRFFEPPYDDLPLRVTEADCHVISQSLVYALNLDDWQTVIEDTDWRLLTAPALVGRQLVFNVAADLPLADATIRQAVAACVDRPMLAAAAGGAPAESYVHPAHPAWVDLGLPTHDPEAAMAQLATLGQSGLTLRLAARDGADRANVEMLVAGLTECGINVQADYLDADAFFAPWPDGGVFGEQYDLVLFPLNAEDGPTCAWFGSANRPSESNPQGPNVSGWQNAAFDDLCARVQATADIEKRVALEREAQAVWRDDLPTLPLYWQLSYAVVDCRVAGYALDPTAVELWNVEQIELTPSCES